MTESESVPGNAEQFRTVGGPMLGPGSTKKVSIYVGEDHSYHGRAAHLAIVEYLFRRGVAAASAFRGIAGFGADHHLHTITIERLTENLPIKIQFIESEEKLGDLLPELYQMSGTGLIDVEDTIVPKTSEPAAGDYSEREQSLNRSATAQFLRICINERDTWRGRPLHQAIVECLRANGVAGVTVYQGWLGFDEHQRPETGRFFQSSHSRPMTLAVVEKEATLQSIIPILDEMIPEGVLALSEVEMIRYTHDFRSVERRKTPRSG